MDRIISGLTRSLHGLGGVVVLLVMVMILYDVISRFLFNAPFHGTDVLAANAMFFIAFLQLPQVLYERGLLRVTILHAPSPPAVQRLLDLLAYVLTAGLFLMLAWQAVHGFEEALRYGEFEGTPSFRIPTAPIRGAAVVLWGIAALVTLANAVNLVARRHPVAERDQPE